MRRPRIQLILPLAAVVGAFVLVARSAAPADAVPGPPQPNGTSASDSGAILVKYRATTTAAQATFVEVARGDQTAGGILSLGITRLNVHPGQAKQSAAAYQQSGLVDFAEEDTTVSTQLTPNDPYFASAYPTTAFGKTSQWAPQFVSAPAAWDTTQGDAAITIAIVDTGIDAGHPDLQGVYTNKDESGIPFERPAQFEGKKLEDVDDSEFAELLHLRGDVAVFGD